MSEKKVKFLCLLIICLCLAFMQSAYSFAAPTTSTTTSTTTPSSTANTITKTFEFTSTTSNFYYDAPKEITENGKQYELETIQYTQLSKTNGDKSTVTKTFDDLSSKTVPNTISQDGKTYTLTGTPTYKTHKEKGESKTYTETKTYPNLIPGEENNKIQESFTKNGITYKKTNQTYTTNNEDFAKTITVSAGTPQGTVSGLNINIGYQTPKQSNWYENFMNYLGYDDNTEIQDVQWASGVLESNGRYVRQIRVTGTQNTRNYTVTYQGKKTTNNGKTYYSATAKYSNTDDGTYKVKATATYKMKAGQETTTETQTVTPTEPTTKTPNYIEDYTEKPDEPDNEEEDSFIDKILTSSSGKNRLPLIAALGAALLAALGVLVVLLIKTKKEKQKELEEQQKAKEAKNNKMKTELEQAKQAQEASKKKEIEIEKEIEKLKKHDKNRDTVVTKNKDLKQELEKEMQNLFDNDIE